MKNDILNSSYWNTFYQNGNNWGQPRSQILEITKELQKVFSTVKVLVLDLACGNGRYSIPLAGLGAKVDSVDFSEVAITQLTTWAEERGLANLINTHCVDVRNFTIKPQQYHLIITSGLFEYLQKTEIHMLIRGIQAGTVTQGINSLVWLLQHPEATVVPGEYPVLKGLVENIYKSSRGWKIVSSQADLKEELHPLESGREPQRHKHYVGRMIVKRII